MPSYTYVAVNLKGHEIKGEHTSPDEQGVANMLTQQGYYPKKIVAKGGFLSGVSLGPKRLPVKVVARLCTQTSAMLRSGVPIVRTLEILETEAENKHMKNVLSDINSSIRQGSSLSEAVKPHEEAFPILFHSMVDAGEASGTLDSCLERAGISFTRTAKLNARVKGAMIYPSIILLVLIGMLVVMLTVVVPQFVQIFQDAGADLPWFTIFLMDSSAFLMQNGIIVLFGVIGVIIMLVVYFRTEPGRLGLDKFKTRVPAISKLLNKVYSARFTRSLSSLVAAGVNMPVALEISSRTVINKFVQQKLETVVEEVKQGVQLSTAIERTEILPQLVTSVTKIGEESGELEEMLTQLADYYDDEADTAVQAMLTVMEPVLILTMAAVVVPILFGVLSPMFQMFEIIDDL